MGRKKKIKILDVYLNGVMVGILRKQTNGSISFKYGDEWLQDGFAISNSLPLQENEYQGEVVFRYLDNLLPDNDDIKKLIATKFGAESIRPFDMLATIGKDCVGALSFLSEELPSDFNFEMKHSPLSKAEIAKRIKSLGKTNPLGMDTADFLSYTTALGLALRGRQ